MFDPIDLSTTPTSPRLTPNLVTVPLLSLLVDGSPVCDSEDSRQDRVPDPFFLLVLKVEIETTLQTYPGSREESTNL